MYEFSLRGYHELLSAFKEAGYSFCGFSDIHTRLAEGKPFVLLRHDIDISLRAALEIARVEYEQGAQATYFVLLRSPFYNVLSRPNVEMMLEIQQYGHQIAAHIDLVPYDNDFTQALTEVAFLSRCYPSLNTTLVSLHSPYDLAQMPLEFEQLKNVYGAVVRGETAYISDSTGRWRYGYPLESEAFKMRKPIQLLTHPIWWVQEGETPVQKLERWLYSEPQNDIAALKAFLPKLFRLDKL